MEMKINFDQLFGSSPPPDFNTTTQFSQQIQIGQSFSQSLNQSYQKYTLNAKLFDFSQNQDQEQILLQDYSVEEPSGKSVRSVNSIKTMSSNKLQQPGQRLYYESKQVEMRKMKQRQKIHTEKQIQINKSTTFIPTINQKSRKLAEKMKYQQKDYFKVKKQIKPTIEVKQQQNLKQCTFKPKLIAKNKRNSPKSTDQLVYYLYNTSKIRDAKIKNIVEENQKQFKTNKKGQGEFEDFLRRNQEYSSKVKQKHKIMKESAEEYDLKTGEKLYSPRIGQVKSFNFHSTNPVKQAKKPSLKQQKSETHANKPQQNKKVNQSTPENAFPNTADKPKCGIFNKKYVQQNSREKQQQMQQQYKQYLLQFERRNGSSLKQGYGSKHEIILQEQQISHNEQSRGSYEGHKNIKADNFNLDLDEEVAIGQDQNIWGSNQIKPFELSNVNQYLNASQEDDPQHKNNYVMQILNNLNIQGQNQVE